MRESYRGMWFVPENGLREILLTGPKFHFKTTSGSGVTIREETFAKEIFAKQIFPDIFPRIYRK